MGKQQAGEKVMCNEAKLRERKSLMWDLRFAGPKKYVKEQESMREQSQYEIKILSEVLQANLNKRSFPPKTHPLLLIVLFGCAGGLKQLIGQCNGAKIQIFLWVP